LEKRKVWNLRNPESSKPLRVLPTPKLDSKAYNPSWWIRLELAFHHLNPSGGAMPENSMPTPRVPDPNEKLVKVFDSEQESEALVVKGLLDSAGIDSDLTSVDAVQDMFPGVGGMVILVREEDADSARRLIEEFRQSGVDDETSEIDLSEDTPTVG
jgi:hypothetical protein